MPTPDDATAGPQNSTLAAQVAAEGDALTAMLDDIPRYDDDMASGIITFCMP